MRMQMQNPPPPLFLHRHISLFYYAIMHPSEKGREGNRIHDSWGKISPPFSSLYLIQFYILVSHFLVIFLSMCSGSCAARMSLVFQPERQEQSGTGQHIRDQANP